jgi:hypothetical protein
MVLMNLCTCRRVICSTISESCRCKTVSQARSARAAHESRGRFAWAVLEKLCHLLGLKRYLGTAIIAAAVGSSAQAQSRVTLAWDPSPGGAIAGYRLYDGVASRTYTNIINAGNVTTQAVGGLTAGVTYFFAVTAYDTNGLESDYSTELSYTVPLPTNPAPVISLTSPTNGSVFPEPASIMLAAAITPNGHTITQVQFYNGATLLRTVAAAPYTYAWTNVSLGTYALSAKAVYDSGSTVNSAAATVTVASGKPPSGLALQIHVGASGSIVLSALGQPGQVYNVLGSQDLHAWTNIGALTLDAAGSGQFTDPAIARPSKNYYRLQGQ